MMLKKLPLFLIIFVFILTGCQVDNDNKSDIVISQIDYLSVDLDRELTYVTYNWGMNEMRKYDLLTGEILNTFPFNNERALHHYFTFEEEKVAIFTFIGDNVGILRHSYPHEGVDDFEYILLILDKDFEIIYEFEMDDELFFFSRTSRLMRTDGNWLYFNFDRSSPYFYRYNIETNERVNLFEVEFPLYIRPFDITPRNQVVFTIGNAEDQNENYFGIFDLETEMKEVFEVDFFSDFPAEYQKIILSTRIFGDYFSITEALIIDDPFEVIDINVTLFNILNMEKREVGLSNNLSLEPRLFANGKFLLTRISNSEIDENLMQFEVINTFTHASEFEFEMEIPEDYLVSNAEIILIQEDIYMVIVFFINESTGDLRFSNAFIKIEEIEDE